MSSAFYVTRMRSGNAAKEHVLFANYEAEKQMVDLVVFSSLVSASDLTNMCLQS